MTPHPSASPIHAARQSPAALLRVGCAWVLNAAAMLWIAAGLATPARAAGGFSPEAVEFFEQRVRPILTERCYSCHSRSSEKLKGGLLLDSREGALKGGDTGPAVAPGDLAASLLIGSIARTNADLAMPPKFELPEEEREVLRKWVVMGAPWSTATPAAAAAGFNLQQRKATHWCWQPVANPAPPRVTNSGWVGNPIDAFILNRLEARGIRPAPAADRRTLIRRATFDLAGLPPTRADVEDFVNDPSPGAFATVVNRLLASPRFGERWARHWMDLVRYAESRGHEFDPDIPNAWQYRDYLVRAFNDDVPYNQFVREHLAGDLVPPRTRANSDANEAILGTGFWFLGEEVHSPVDIRQDEADRIDNRLDVMGKAFLGVTLGCARCHDHKFDAISQRDYYGLTGFLVSSSYRQARFESLGWNGRIAARLDAALGDDRRCVAEAAKAALKPVVDGMVPAVLAAAEVMRGTPIETAAAHQNIAIDAIQIWRAALALAPIEPRSPLQQAAALVHGTNAPDASRPRPAGGEWNATNLVADFGQCGGFDLLQDGSSFGLRPSRAGDLLLGPDHSRPLLGVAQFGGAYRDPLWLGLKARTASRDAGTLGNWERAEQTIKTPEFRLTSGSLWYRVRGAGRAYAVVDSHLLVNGPLHGALLLEWNASPEGWRWIHHPLDDYHGHRLHIEFSPVGDELLAVSAVVQGGERPGGPSTAGPNPPPATSLQAEAGRVRAVLTQALSALGCGAGPSDESLGAADWLAANFETLCPAGSGNRKSFDAATRTVYQRRAALASQIRKQSACAPAMFEGSGIDEFVLSRGSTHRPTSLAPRRFLEAVDGPAPMPISRGSGRLELAEAILRPSNPLTARVMANRVWSHLFGRGIVATVDNFGALGQRPTHPELLDYLARRFEGPLDWSIKSLLREILLSNTYQMDSRSVDPDADAADPENLLLHRQNLRRLEGEAIRDSILAASGSLDGRIGGPSVPIYLTSFMDGRGRPAASGPIDGDGRRSLYVAIRRNFLSPMMLAFDTPIPFNAVGRRNVSNIPAQALTLMNDPFIVGQAKLWAQRLPHESAQARIVRVYETAFGRPPSTEESSRLDAFAVEQSRRLGVDDPADPRVWADICHALFNVKEFIYLN